MGCGSNTSTNSQNQPIETSSPSTPSPTTTPTSKPSIRHYINNNKCDQVLDKVFYSVCYDYSLKAPLAVGYTLSGDLVNELNIVKRPYYKVEYAIEKKYRASKDDYVGTGYDRSHIGADAAFDWSQESLDSVYSLVNIMPQARKVNRYTWTKAERLERILAVQLGEVSVVNLLLYTKNPKRIGSNRIAVPKGIYKIFFNHEKKYKKCLYYENDNNIITSEDRLTNHQVNCSEIE